ncbi:hypothetical protein [Burkholderia diffusa]|uniref:hypothetical protein n=1 Tax=Burkholderia diffusa TaxID=488732 RepID=UPI0012D9F1F4|nr:hypothetical protein [Burkholderia diffusa]
MLKPVLTPLASTLVALSCVTFTAGAFAQQQPAAPAVQHQSNAIVAADTAQLVARSNGGGNVRSDAPTKAVVPLRTAPASTPATPDSDCVGPVSFCNVYFGS